MHHDYRYINIRAAFDLFTNNDVNFKFVKAFYKQLGYAGRPTWFIQYVDLDTQVNHLLIITNQPFLFRLWTIHDLSFFPKGFAKTKGKDLFDGLASKGIVSNRTELSFEKYRHVADFITKELFSEL